MDFGTLQFSRLAVELLFPIFKAVLGEDDFLSGDLKNHQPNAPLFVDRLVRLGFAGFQVLRFNSSQLDTMAGIGRVSQYNQGNSGIGPEVHFAGDQRECDDQLTLSLEFLSADQNRAVKELAVAEDANDHFGSGWRSIDTMPEVLEACDGPLIESQDEVSFAEPAELGGGVGG